MLRRMRWNIAARITEFGFSPAGSVGPACPGSRAGGMGVVAVAFAAFVFSSVLMSFGLPCGASAKGVVVTPISRVIPDGRFGVSV
jgi:hypothetical protein